ncbi:MAG: hypothetical protein BWK73_29455 [Thiothrix lacustris]|uniref:Uncharacterized protein n=1 Tax=Thiothrix lacustris TaxID=525917 RepID=A0A1Y1QJI8_9GAMM|nr:MAG: hypothetical protein BWK73_29455 [Thiothrix lacustris]
MPKLVIKQDVPKSSLQDKLENMLRVALPLLLFGIAAIAALSIYFDRKPSVSSEVIVDEAGQALKLPMSYTQQEIHLASLQHTFEVQEKHAVASYDKHSSLVAKADAILQQLATLDGVVVNLDIDTHSKQTLLTRHQYQKDYWEAKRVFHNLRLARFNNPAPPEVTSVVRAEKVETAATESVEPAPPVELPADFCPLFGPGAAACKPGADKKP